MRIKKIQIKFRQKRSFEIADAADTATLWIRYCNYSSSGCITSEAVKHDKRFTLPHCTNLWHQNSALIFFKVSFFAKILSNEGHMISKEINERRKNYSV